MVWKKNIIYYALKETLSLLPFWAKKKLGLLSLSLLINSMADLISIAAIFPLFAIVLKEGLIQENKYLNWLYTSGGFSSTSSFIFFLATLFLFFALGKNIVYLYSKRYQAKFSFELFEYFTNKSLQNYYEKGYLYLSNNNSNNMIHNAIHIPRVFSMMTLLPLFTLLNELFVILIIFIVLLSVYYQAVLGLFILVLPIFILFYNQVKNKIKEVDEDINDLVPQTTKSFFDIIFGFQDIQISNTYPFFKKKFTNTIEAEVKLRTKYVVFSELPIKIVEMSVILSLLFILLYCFYFFNTNQEIITFLTVFALSTFRLTPSFNKILTALMQVKSKSYVFKSLKSVEKSPTNPPPNTKHTTEKMGLKEVIKIDNISFKYNNNKPILKGIDFEIYKGDFLGIIGPSGSGKTTLVGILLRLLEESQGGIYVDGKKLDSTNSTQWINSIGYVKQDVFLIDGSIEENIAFGETNIDYSRLEKVIQQASLNDFVDSLPGKYKTSIGERGALVSGGQRQRIGVARALYKNPSLIIFDESTSSLDANTCKAFMETIKKLSLDENLTIIFITHDTNTLKYCTKVYELNKRKLIPQNNP